MLSRFVSSISSFISLFPLFAISTVYIFSYKFHSYIPTINVIVSNSFYIFGKYLVLSIYIRGLTFSYSLISLHQHMHVIERHHRYHKELCWNSIPLEGTTMDFYLCQSFFCYSRIQFSMFHSYRDELHVFVGYHVDSYIVYYPVLRDRLSFFFFINIWKYCDIWAFSWKEYCKEFTVNI